MNTTKDFDPDYATPPGFTLEEVLDDRAITQADLAARTGLSTKHINQLIQGKVSLTVETALKLERATGVPARIWNNLECKYQEQKLRLADDVALDEHLGLLDDLPVSEMQAVGVLSPGGRPIDQLREALAFFGVADVPAWQALRNRHIVAFRKSPSGGSNDMSVEVWLRMGELAAIQLPCARWSRDKFRAALSEVRALTQSGDPESWYPDLVRLCADAGVAVVVLPEVKGARTHGATRWLAPDRPMIQLSLRYRWADIFWFTFFHEAKHVLDEQKRRIFVESQQESTGERAGDEAAADKWAGDFLIPAPAARQLPQIRSLEDVVQFAADQGVHPGIVIGRLHHERLWARTHGNKLRQRLQFTAR